MTIQRPGIMARSRASCAVVGVVLAAVLVVGASGEALTTGLPRTVDPLTGMDQIPSDPRADPLPTPVPSETRTLDAALDQTWWVSKHDGRWVAGTFGGRRVALDVPVDAHLATAFGHIAGWSGSEADGYDVFVIEPTTGRCTILAHLADRPGDVTAAADQGVVYVGAPADGQGRERGVLRIDAGGTDRVIEGHGRDGVARDGLAWSPDGRSLASRTCEVGSGEPCMVDVLDIATGRAAEAGPIFSIATDGAYLLGSLPVDADGRRPWMTLDVASGATREVASDVIDRTESGWFLDDGTVLVSGLTTDRTRHRIAVADPSTGTTLRIVQDVATDDPLTLRYPLGRDARAPWALLWAADSEGELPDDAVYRVLDVRTGHVLPDRVVIRP